MTLQLKCILHEGKKNKFEENEERSCQRTTNPAFYVFKLVISPGLFEDFKLNQIK